jgi:DNA mismatch repair protein MutL
MESLIHLLPESLSNHIAAGEVVQRPASVVKELLENSRDAGAGHIQLVLQDAGKTLIQVVDDGLGMSPADARMAFERHATSKINRLEDLFSIRSFGFRGEALASIAAVSQITMKTRRPQDEVGTEMALAGGQVQRQEPCQAPVGTSLSVRNLFYNVPARRNFLKSNPVETRHVTAEFTRMALAYPELRMTLVHNQTTVYDLLPAELDQRILDVYNNLEGEQLLPVSESTDYLSVAGFLGTPAAARRSRGDQYFFVNQRFIRSPYLHHAVASCYEQLIAKAAHPFYVLMLTIDPRHIDINIHPTKTEIKFDEERTVYALLHSAVKKALAGLHQAPEPPTEASVAGQVYRQPVSREHESPTLKQFLQQQEQQAPARGAAGNVSSSGAAGGNAPAAPRTSGGFRAAWEALYKQQTPQAAPAPQPHQPAQGQAGREQQLFGSARENQLGVLSMRGGYLITVLGEQLYIVDQAAAYGRVIYEELTAKAAHRQVASQRLLYPFALELEADEAELIQAHESMLEQLGFELQWPAAQRLLVNGLPAELDAEAVSQVFTELRTALAAEGSAQETLHAHLLRSIARQATQALRHTLKPAEAQQLLERLFACQEPGLTPDGGAVFYRLPRQQIDRQLGRSSATD